MAKDIILPADLGGDTLTPEELAATPDFSGIRKEIWSKFPGAIARKTYRPGEIICREGETGTTAFYILSGTVDIFLSTPIVSAQAHRKRSGSGFFRSLSKITSYVKGVPDRSSAGVSAPERTHIPIDGSVDLPLDNPIATLGAGEIFGELCALAAFKQEKIKRAKFYPRSATVRASSDVVLFEMLPNILNNVLYTSPAFKEKLNTQYRTRALDNHLRSVPIFRGLEQSFIDYLRERVELVDFQPGEVICRQGDIADSFYLIRLGFVKVSQDFPGGEMVLTYLSRGSYFGEIGLLSPTFQVRARGTEVGQITETMVAQTPVICGRAPAGERILEVAWDPLLSREHFEMQVVGNRIRVRQLETGRNPILFRMQPVRNFVLSPGESFVVGGTTFEVGETSQRSGRRTATCAAMDFVQLVRIKAEDFGHMLEAFPDVAAAIHDVARRRQQMDAQILNRLQVVSLNEFLNQELMQAQNLLLLDLDRCTRCDECVKACAATHDDGITRLIREGLRFDRFLVPTSCRACMDPLCMTRCPVGSIRRKETLEIVIEDWCIGCGNCATDCPYGNINVVEMATNGARKQKAEARPKAVVCDLCHEFAEPNCVRACPHGAALRVEPKTFFARELAGMQLAVQSRVQGEMFEPESPAPAPAGRAVPSSTEVRRLRPHLKIISGAHAGSVLELNVPLTTIGRDAGNDHSFAGDMNISRNHCIIQLENDRYVLTDLNSANGTLVNGNPITEIELRPGDVIQIGEVAMEFAPNRAAGIEA